MRLQVGDIDAFNYLPYLDGKPLGICVMADEEAGEVEIMYFELSDLVEQYPTAEVCGFKQGEKIAKIKGKVELKRLH